MIFAVIECDKCENSIKTKYAAMSHLIRDLRKKGWSISPTSDSVFTCDKCNEAKKQSLKSTYEADLEKLEAKLEKLKDRK